MRLNSKPLSPASALKALQKTIGKAYTNKGSEAKDTLFPALNVLEAITGKSESFLLANPAQELSKKEMVCLKQTLSRIKKQEPLQYILGHADFYNSRFIVDSGVLIPRPETEGVVEIALKWLNSAKSRDRKDNGKIETIDVGTGSGCIIVSLAKALKEKNYSNKQFGFTATDISSKALETAKQNAIKTLGKKHNIQFVKADLFPTQSIFPQRFTLITANLPYISTEEYKRLPQHIRQYEPKQALEGGKTGDKVVEKFLAELPNKLRPDGIAIMELAPKMHKKIGKKCKKLGLSAKSYRKRSEFRYILTIGR